MIHRGRAPHNTAADRIFPFHDVRSPCVRGLATPGGDPPSNSEDYPPVAEDLWRRGHNDGDEIPCRKNQQSQRLIEFHARWRCRPHDSRESLSIIQGDRLRNETELAMGSSSYLPGT